MDPPHAEHAAAIRARLPSPLKVIITRDFKEAGGPRPVSDPVPDPALGALRRATVVTYTSGSTGRPKGVCQPLTGWNDLVLDDAVQLAAENPVMLVVTPLSHAAGPMADAVPPGCSRCRPA